MGEVYLAEDSRLKRKIALKFLPEHLAVQETYRDRFLREARSASALNHPNIITIYEILSHNHLDVIAMEYVEGESLRTILSRGSISIKTVLDIAAQVASALAAAHRIGIVHRDIKPENIMLARGDQIKVLDFGLAKLFQTEADGSTGSQLTTAEQPAQHTRSGVIVGTVAYMSPEQGEGRDLDGRSDLFSLGVVLYEMLTGKRPFAGASAVDTLNAIVHQEPKSAFELNPRLPVEARDILEKSLAKNPNDRYQHAGDLEIDLRRLKRALESNTLISARIERRPSPRSWRSYLWIGVLFLLAAVAVIAWHETKRTAGPPAQDDRFAKLTLTPLTVDPGLESSPTFSPDGETLAYVSDRTGNFEVFLRHVSGGPEINLTNNPADDVQPAFSPDGKEIAFVSTRSGKTGLHYPGPNSPQVGGDIWVMPAFGGTPKRIVESANFPSWSPDGSQILYVKGSFFGQKIYRIPAEGGSAVEIPLLLPSTPRFYYPRYSKDGRWILFDDAARIYVAPANGGKPVLIGAGSSAVWNDAARTIVYSCAEPGKNYSLFEIAFSSKEGKTVGVARPLTFGRGRDLQATISADGKRIAFTAFEMSFNMEVMPFDADGGGQTGEPNALTLGNNVIYFHDFSPDGRSIVFQSDRGSRSSVWKLDLAGGLTQLTSNLDYNDTYPRFSPDGKSIAFSRTNSEQPGAVKDLWMMDADGANPHPVGFSLKRNMVFFVWTQDAKSLIYADPSDGQFYAQDIATKKKTRLTNEELIYPVSYVTPDGQWLIYQSGLSGSGAILRAVRIAGGSSQTVVASTPYAYHPFVSPSGKWLYFQDAHKNIFRVPGPALNWQKAEPQQMTHFPESGLYIEDPQISRDGSKLLYSRGKMTGDIWLIESR